MPRYNRRPGVVEAQQFVPGDTTTPWPAGVRTSLSGYEFGAELINPRDWMVSEVDGSYSRVVPGMEFLLSYSPAESSLETHLIKSTTSLDRLDLPPDLTESEVEHCLAGNFADFSTPAAPKFFVQGRAVDESGFRQAVAGAAKAIPLKEGGHGSAVGWISRGAVPEGFKL